MTGITIAIFAALALPMKRKSTSVNSSVNINKIQINFFITVSCSVLFGSFLIVF